MRRIPFVIILAAAFCCANAMAMTADEALKLKQAGVSDATIQKMLELERVQGQGPVTEQNGQVVYRAGEQNASRREANQAHERWKEEKAMDALKGMVIDARPNQPLDGAKGSGGQ